MNAGFDAWMPADMAQRAEDVGVSKVGLPAATMLVLAVLAGAFIALGAMFSTVSITGAADALPYGVTRVLGGVTFSLGLILVVIAGAELFTGNNLIVMAWAGSRVTTRALLFNWMLVYIGNVIGSVATAVLAFVAGQHEMAGGQLGVVALEIANAKCDLDFIPAFARGILCNALVCLAVWISFSARTTTDRILAVIPPIAAFVACGFEHCVANMFFIPFGLLIHGGADAAFWSATGADAANYAALSVDAFLWKNLFPVTLGNILGGAGLVGLIYWFVYLRPRTNS